MNYQNLKYRRQFLFTNMQTNILENWNLKEIKFNDQEYNLLTHPDLGVSHAKSNLEIYLLGYILNPFEPLQTNEDIINEFVAKLDYKDVLKRTDYYNGRYVMIILDNSNLFIINDATGAKKVFYYFHDNEIWISSTPNLIQNYKQLENTNNELVLQFLNSDRYQNFDSTWFGEETPYADVYSLIPNHLIDINNRQVERFWPGNFAEKRTLNQSIEYASEIMRGTLKSAANRFKLHASLTGGWDSRMILSSMKEIIGEINFYTFVSQNVYKKNINDILIPRKIVEKYKLNYTTVELDNNNPPQEFLNVFKSNSVFNRNTYAAIYYNFINNGFENHINVTGTTGDQVLRAFYRLKGDITAKKLAAKFEYHHFPYVVNSIDKWLEEVTPLQKESPIHLIDWYNWEFYSGNWSGNSTTEHDIARDELRIVNCRELITTFMQIPDKFRYRDNPLTHKMLVRRNWKELLDFNVEPSNVQFRKLKKILRALLLEQKVENLYQNIKYSLNKFNNIQGFSR